MMVYVATRRGAGKEQSEDSVLVGDNLICDAMAEFEFSTSGVIGVADGVGGNVGGHIASAFITERLKHFSILGSVINDEKIREWLIGLNNGLLEEGKKAGLSELATTLTALMYVDGQKYIVHIGNTRAYVLQGQYLKQLTIDHTVYNRLLKMGRIDEASICRRNEITNCLGGGDPVLAASLSVSPCQEFNTMLLTSDGVHDFIELDKLEHFLMADGTGLDKCNSIIQTAIDAGSKDDLTVIIIEK